MNEVALKHELVNRTLNYLATRPYAEVNVIISEIMSTARPIDNKAPEIVPNIPVSNATE